jgi:hypothetical protein
MIVLVTPRALRALLIVIGLEGLGALVAVGCKPTPCAPPPAAPAAPRKRTLHSLGQLDTGSYKFMKFDMVRAWVWSFGPAKGLGLPGEREAPWGEIWVLPDLGPQPLGSSFSIDGEDASTCSEWSRNVPDADASIFNGTSTEWSCEGGVADAGTTATILAAGSYTVTAPDGLSGGSLDGKIYVDNTGEYWALSRLITTGDHDVQVSAMEHDGYRDLHEFIDHVCDADSELPSKYQLSFQDAGAIDCD